MKYWISAALLIAALPVPAMAQDYGSDQAAATELRNAIQRLARRPTDSDALLDAGNAALMLRDYDSALGFFTRAEALQPSSGRVKAGLASSQLYSENPVEALRLFDEAVRLGISERSIAADRGLAYDLVGNNFLAQAQYALGSSAVSTEELIIRQAVSFGLAGDQKRADALLNPLLTQNKPGAWRARAFILAGNGDVAEAVRIVRGFLDARSTSAMQSYLERMSALTKAQQAAVIHYGHFPAEEQVGRDSDAVRAIASRGPAPRAGARGQDRGLIPSGEPLGRRTRASADRSAGGASRAASERQTRASRRAEAKARAAARNQPAASVAPVPQPSAAAPTPSPTASVPVQVAQAELPAVSAPVAQTMVAGTGLPDDAAVASVPDSAATRIAAADPAGPGFETLAPSSASGEAESQAAGLQNEDRLAADAAVRPTVVASIADSVSSAPMVGPSADLAATSAAGTAGAAAAGMSNDPVPSLGAIVRSIDIPPQEQQANVFAVDLERLEQYKNAKPLGPVSGKAAASPGVAAASPFAQKPMPSGAKPLGDDAVKAAPATKKAAKPAAKPDAKPAADPQPARNWVQIATGGNDLMKNEYRRLARGKTELFKGRKGWTSPFKSSARLQVGPFDSIAAARDWLGDFEEAGGQGFAWNSDDGTVVTPLP